MLAPMIAAPGQETDMPKAWACIANSDHGPFLQAGLQKLAREVPGLQGMGRFACPICRADGFPGYVRPAEESEVARLATPTAEV